MNTSLSENHHEFELDLRHLRVFEALIRERNLTRAAGVLGVTQPALSKTLANLRKHFSDQLLVRVGHRMEPTTKALELEASIRDILDRVTSLRAAHVPFDPTTSSRTFRFSVVDAGLIRLLPPLIKFMHEQAPRIRLRVIPLDLNYLESSLESGQLDFAMGSFPSLSLTKRIRRQVLWPVTYISAVRKDHPRLDANPSLAAFAAERHVLVSAAGTGHAHTQAERAIEKAVPVENITCRVPSFITAACVASMTDAVVTLPTAMARVFADQLGLRLFAPPLKLPDIDVSQYWHERFHREPGNQWVRSLFATMFAEVH